MFSMENGHDEGRNREKLHCFIWEIKLGYVDVTKMYLVGHCYFGIVIGGLNKLVCVGSSGYVWFKRAMKS